MARRVIRNASDWRSTQTALNRKLKALLDVAQSAPARAIGECLKDTLAKSVQRVPIDEGNLIQAAHVSVDGIRYVRGTVSRTVNGDIPDLQPAREHSFEIGYTVEGGGRGTEGDVNTYAVIQHEHTEYSHPNGGEAKYLESAIDEERPNWPKRIAQITAEEARKEAAD